MDKPKKKFYKRWWFWVIIAVLVIGSAGAGGAAGSGSDDKDKAAVEQTAEKDKEAEKAAKEEQKEKEKAAKEKEEQEEAEKEKKEEQPKQTKLERISEKGKDFMSHVKWNAVFKYGADVHWAIGYQCIKTPTELKQYGPYVAITDATITNSYGADFDTRIYLFMDNNGNFKHLLYDEENNQTMEIQKDSIVYN